MRAILHAVALDFSASSSLPRYARDGSSTYTRRDGSSVFTNNEDDTATSGNLELDTFEVDSLEVGGTPYSQGSFLSRGRTPHMPKVHEHQRETHGNGA